MCLDVMRLVRAYGCGVFVSLSEGAAEGGHKCMCAVCCWLQMPSNKRPGSTVG